MPTRFDLPTLSDKDYAKLRDELTSAIPKYSSNWTDFNYSDPGITLLQLLCWIGDITLYRIDAVPTALYLNFVRWIVGGTGQELDKLITTLENDVVRKPDGTVLYLAGAEVYMDPERLALAQHLRDVEQGRHASVTDLRRWAVAFWRSPYRAVTTGDFAELTKQVCLSVPPDAAEFLISRVVVLTEQPYIRVLPVTAYVYGYSIALNAPKADGRVVMILTSKLQLGTRLYVSQSYDALVMAVDAYLKPRRILGTPIAVEPPVFNPLVAVLRLACLSDANPSNVLTNANQAIMDRLSATSGGTDGKGWPYGQPVTPGDLVSPLSNVAGIDHSQPIQVEMQTIKGIQVGSAVVGSTTYFGPGEAVGLPLPWVIEIIDMTDTWTIEVGVHARIGIDTVLPYPEH